MANKTRPNQVTFRLSDSELDILKSRIEEAGMSQQEFLRHAALDKKIISTDGIKEILPEMKKQGVNLNQMTKRLNERQYVDYDGNLKSTLDEVKAVWQSLRQLIAKHR